MPRYFLEFNRWSMPVAPYTGSINLIAVVQVLFLYVTTVETDLWCCFAGEKCVRGLLNSESLLS